MKLTAKVTARERDRERGILITGDFAGGGYFHKVANVDGLDVDDEVVVLVLRQDEAASAYQALADAGDLLIGSLVSLRNQLRPDVPPPLLINDADAYQQRYDAMPSPDTAETQEFVREEATK